MYNPASSTLVDLIQPPGICLSDGNDLELQLAIILLFRNGVMWLSYTYFNEISYWQLQTFCLLCTICMYCWVHSMTNNPTNISCNILPHPVYTKLCALSHSRQMFYCLIGSKVRIETLIFGLSSLKFFLLLLAKCVTLF